MKEFWTKTMADLYVSQGYIREALEIYRYLLSKDPESEDIKSKISDLVEQNKKNKITNGKVAALRGWLRQVKEKAAVYEARRYS